jgi:CDP-diacylglycerol---serine O-phosphatidyltransferase
LNFFTGAPAPAGAGLAMAPMYLGFLGVVTDGHAFAWLVLPYIFAVALLMISRVPTFSGKALGSRISRDLVLPILGMTALLAVSLIAFTWEVLTALCLTYIALLPFGVASYRRQKAAHDRRLAEEQGLGERP